MSPNPVHLLVSPYPPLTPAVCPKRTSPKLIRNKTEKQKNHFSPPPFQHFFSHPDCSSTTDPDIALGRAQVQALLWSQVASRLSILVHFSQPLLLQNFLLLQHRNHLQFHHRIFAHHIDSYGAEWACGYFQAGRIVRTEAAP